jgi:carboxyl-terminal processing protease
MIGELRDYHADITTNYGTFGIPSFGGAGWGGEIVDVFDALGSVPGLIVDIRNNNGGSEDIALDVASHFTDSKRVYRSAQFRDGRAHGDFGPTTTFSVAPKSPRFAGPVALLTNRFDGSAAEEFTLMMRILPTVVTVGDTTLGLGSNPLRITLSNGWSYRVPQSIQKAPDGFVYQWHGLPPRIAVSWTDADTSGGHDPYVDAALAELRRLRK